MKESERLVQYLNAVPEGRILSVAVNDEGSRNLDDGARKAMTKLGSKHFLRLGFRYHPRPTPTRLRDPGYAPQSTLVSVLCLQHAGLSAGPGEWLAGRPPSAMGAYLGAQIFLQSVFHS